MAYIGHSASGNFTTKPSKDTFSGDGSTTAFTLSEGATTNTVDVFVENVRQEPTTAYTVDGTTLTFTAAPGSGTNNIYVVNRGPLQLSATHPAAQALEASTGTFTGDLEASTGTFTGDLTIPSINNGQIGGRRNLLLNGAHNIQQRSGSSVAGLTEADDGLYTVDAWRFTASANTTNTGVLTMSVETDAPAGSGFKYSTKYLITTADTSLASDQQLRLEQHLEAQNIRHLNYGTSSAKQLTMSFWVKSNKTGNYSAGLFLDSPASGSDTQISQVYTINSANTWEYKTVTFPANTTTVINATDTDHGLRAWFVQAAGSDYTSGTIGAWGGTTNRSAGQVVNLYDTVNNYWQVTGCQLEVGAVATEFEHRSFGDELALCQRYYRRLERNNSANDSAIARGVAAIRIGIAQTQSTTRANSIIDFPVTMRAMPTLEVSAIADIDYAVGTTTPAATDFTIDGTPSVQNAFLRWTDSGGGLTPGHAGRLQINAEGKHIAFDAEM